MTNRKIEIKKQMKSFIKAKHADRLKMLSYGVEFEYQSSACDKSIKSQEDEYIDSLDWEERYDDEALYERAMEMTSNDIDREFRDYLLNSDLSKYMRNAGNKGLLFSRFDLWLERNNKGSDHEEFIKFSELHPHLFSENFSEYDLKDRLEDDNREYLINSCDYEYDRDILLVGFDRPCGEREIETAYEWVEDESVSGGEIRTTGGLEHWEFTEASKDIISEIKNHDSAFIDVNCSAHLHIKLGDIFHSYGENLHALIMEYFYYNMEQLPESIKERLCNGGNRHIRPLFENQKFSWVNFHSQGTIEFRLFGNISNYKDFEKCINMAVNALAYAYKMRLKRRDIDLYKFSSITVNSKRAMADKFQSFAA